MDYLFLFFLSVILLFITSYISKKFKIYDFVDKKKIHKENVSNIGGLALIPYVFLLFYFYDYNNEISLTLNLFLLVVIIGLVDDIKNINPQTKILALLIPIYIFTKEVVVVKTLGSYEFFDLNLGSLSFIFTILCIFLLTNAYNYIDGMDGLIASNIIISLITLYLLIETRENILITLIIFLAVYFLFNTNLIKFLPKQFLGDSGSLAFGFILSSFLIIFTQTNTYIHPSIIIWTVSFVVYEFLSINIIRIKLSKNIFERDLNFIFNLYLKKYSTTKTLIFCNLIHLFFCGISFIVSFFKIYFFSLILFILIFFVYLYFRFKQTNIKI